MRLHLVTAPEDEPLTWEQCQKWLRLEGLTDEQDFIQTIAIPSARERCENATLRQLLTAVWEFWLDAWPCDYIEIPKPPLVSIASIKYIDLAGVEQTWAANQYQVTAPSGPRCARGRVAPAYGITWPSVRDQLDAIKVQFTCGYGTAAKVPPSLVTAMLRDVDSIFRNRDNYVTGTIVAELPDRSARTYFRFKSFGRAA